VAERVDNAHNRVSGLCHPMGDVFFQDSNYE